MGLACPRRYDYKLHAFSRSRRGPFCASMFIGSRRTLLVGGFGHASQRIWIRSPAIRPLREAACQRRNCGALAIVPVKPYQYGRSRRGRATLAAWVRALMADRRAAWSRASQSDRRQLWAGRSPFQQSPHAQPLRHQSHRISPAAAILTLRPLHLQHLDPATTQPAANPAHSCWCPRSQVALQFPIGQPCNKGPVAHWCRSYHWFQ